MYSTVVQRLQCTVYSTVKIQMNQEARLTDDEKEAVQVFLIEDIDRDIEERELSFVESVLLEAEAQRKKRAKVL